MEDKELYLLEILDTQYKLIKNLQKKDWKKI